MIIFNLETQTIEYTGTKLISGIDIYMVENKQRRNSTTLRTHNRSTTMSNIDSLVLHNNWELSDNLKSKLCRAGLTYQRKLFINYTK